jgi:lipoprotein-anchoring transpeptidase ErfK/SrfK
MRASFGRILIALAWLPVLAGCYKAVPDPQVSALDERFMALSPQAESHPQLARYEMSDPTGELPGTVVVEQKERRLYYVLPGGRAIRYSVTVGNEAFGWSGTADVARKAEWPAWNPPAEMKARWPHVHAVEGGPLSPMGARALYLHQNGRDTLYRIHGTNEPEMIGQAASSGCIRLRNMDMVDLYNRVPVGAKVIVR